MDGYAFDPYCGRAPLPEEFWSRWNFDPAIVLGLAVLAGLWLVLGRRDAKGSMAMTGALALLAVAFISPLCALASALFSARVAHHLVMIAGAAPLLVLAFPRSTGTGLSLTPVFLLHTALLWIWHAPSPYAFALSSPGAYWLMQLSLLGSAFLLWRELLAQSAQRGPALMTLLATMMQMGLLGALLVFAPRAVFTPHFATTMPFGLTPLEDQQLAGVLMWAPAMVPYVAAALIQLMAMIAPARAETAR